LPNWVKQLPIPLFVISLFVVREDYFGYTMPLLIAGCFLMVAKGANSKDWDIRFLASKPMTYIGERSYSLYLWHWPILVFSKELGFPQTVEAKLILLAICIALAIPSYRFIEVPFQNIKIPEFKVDLSEPIMKTKWVAGSATLVATILLIPSIVVQPGSQSAIASIFPKTQFIAIDTNIPNLPNSPGTEGESGGTHGWLQIRQAEIKASNDAIAKAGKLSVKQISEIQRVADGQSYAGGFGFTCTWGDCTLGNPAAKTRILVLGSSYSLMYAATYAAMSQQGESLYVQMFTSRQCPNVLEVTKIAKTNAGNVSSECELVHDKVLDHVNHKKGFYDFVVLSDKNWAGTSYKISAINYANIVKSAGAKTVIMGQPPAGKDLASCLNRNYSNYSFCSNSRESSLPDYEVANLSHVSFGDISDLFCLETFCPLLINEAPTSAMGHLTDVSAASIAPYFLDFLRDAEAARK
jgi:hypothetical protein